MAARITATCLRPGYRQLNNRSFNAYSFEGAEHKKNKSTNSALTTKNLFTDPEREIMF